MSESPEPRPESDEPLSNDFEGFIKYNYGESKELGKLFITVLSGILLFSINFSDKVGGIQNAPPYYRFLLLGSWSCLLISTYLGKRSGPARSHPTRLSRS